MFWLHISLPLTLDFMVKILFEKSQVCFIQKLGSSSSLQVQILNTKDWDMESSRASWL